MYDLNLDQSFTDFQELKSLDFKGYCLCQEIDETKLKSKPVINQINNTVDSAVHSTVDSIVYSRANVQYTSKLDASSMNNLSKFDIICIKGVDNSNINSVLKLNPDLISLKSEEIKHLKRSFINNLKQKDIYIEILIKEALYGSKDRIVWMNNVRRLLKFGCSLVISSGASVLTELKSSSDICKILNIFNLSDDKIKKIIKNSEKVLRNAAIKRYANHTVIADNFNLSGGNLNLSGGNLNLSGGNLKRDFLL
jgi:RNase P/RNase MRP subunit p30